MRNPHRRAGDGLPAADIAYTAAMQSAADTLCKRVRRYGAVGNIAHADQVFFVQRPGILQAERRGQRDMLRRDRDAGPSHGNKTEGKRPPDERKKGGRHGGKPRRK